MKGGMRAATALGIGYLLGRRRKLRTATLMAAATAVGGTDVGGLVLRRGMKMLGSTEVLSKVAPQFGELAETVRGDLVTAGKAAATAAVSNRVDSLTDSLHDRAERLRNPGAAVAEGAGEAAETAGRAASGGARRATSTVGGTARRMTGRRGAGTAEPEDEDYRDDEDLPEEEVDEAEDYEGGEPDEYEADEPDEGEPEEPDEVRPRRAAGRRSPVTRARR